MVESPLNNSSVGMVPFRNNYSTGDIYGEVFTTKSVLDSLYDMNLTGNIKALGREYIGLGSCSDQLSLVFRPTTVNIDINADGSAGNTHAIKENESPLKYQRVEVVKNINRFESSIKHKSNVFSVVVKNTNLAKDPTGDAAIEAKKKQLRDSVT